MCQSRWKFGGEIGAGLYLHIRCLCFMIRLFCVLSIHNTLAPCRTVTSFSSKSHGRVLCINESRLKLNCQCDVLLRADVACSCWTRVISFTFAYHDIDERCRWRMTLQKCVCGWWKRSLIKQKIYDAPVIYCSLATAMRYCESINPAPQQTTPRSLKHNLNFRFSVMQCPNTTTNQAGQMESTEHFWVTIRLIVKINLNVKLFLSIYTVLSLTRSPWYYYPLWEVTVYVT